MPSILVCDAPERTTFVSARPPSKKESASTMIDFPAPVSPVRTVNPDESSRSRCSIVAKSVTLRNVSIGTPVARRASRMSLAYRAGGQAIPIGCTWQAKLDESDGRRRCGGSIIDRGAAHASCIA